MARTLDYSDLNQDDVEYIRQRPWLVVDAQQNGYDIQAILEGDSDSAQKLDLDEEPAPDEAGDGESDPGEEEADYSAFTVDELKAEIDRRNEEYDDESQISKAGNKAQLIAALTEDDEAEVVESTDS